MKANCRRLGATTKMISPFLGRVPDGCKRIHCASIYPMPHECVSHSRIDKSILALPNCRSMSCDDLFGIERPDNERSDVLLRHLMRVVLLIFLYKKRPAIE
jgi:hypothetical protein